MCRVFSLRGPQNFFGTLLDRSVDYTYMYIYEKEVCCVDCSVEYKIDELTCIQYVHVYSITVQVHSTSCFVNNIHKPYVSIIFQFKCTRTYITRSCSSVGKKLEEKASTDCLHGVNVIR